ncbi:cytochrome P450 [Streptomyces sp. NPDC093224]|uniref:cytochrome P450 n=1 Tax=Streptomyces sp. NPDC093224 TaxID=3155198 RepID=UPI0034251FFE
MNRRQCPVEIDAAGSDVHAEAAVIRGRGPAVRVVLPGGVGAWAVNGHAEIRRLLADPRVSKDAYRHWPAWIDGEVGARWPLAIWVSVQNMITAYGAEHARLRRPVAGAFTTRRVAAMRPRIEEIVGELLESLAAAGPGEVVDLRGRLAHELPTRVVFELFGIPERSWAPLHKIIKGFFDTGISAEDAQRNAADLDVTMADLVAYRRAHPGDDLTSALIAARDGHGDDRPGGHAPGGHAPGGDASGGDGGSGGDGPAATAGSGPGVGGHGPGDAPDGHDSALAGRGDLVGRDGALHGQGSAQDGHGDALVGRGGALGGCGDALAGYDDVPVGYGSALAGYGDALDEDGGAPDGHGGALAGRGEALGGHGNAPVGYSNALAGHGDVPDGDGRAVDGRGDATDGCGEVLAGRGDALDGHSSPLGGCGSALDGRGDALDGRGGGRGGFRGEGSGDGRVGAGAGAGPVGGGDCYGGSAAGSGSAGSGLGGGGFDGDGSAGGGFGEGSGGGFDGRGSDARGGGESSVGGFGGDGDGVGGGVGPGGGRGGAAGLGGVGQGGCPVGGGGGPAAGAAGGGVGRGMSEKELLDNLILLFTAGYETSANLICTALHRLLVDPGQLAAVRRGDASWEDAVEEALRVDAPAFYGLLRFAVEDIDMGEGVVIGRGDPIIVSFGAAGRDPAVHGADADRFDVLRPTRGQHLSFGFGTHHCLGAALARAECAIALRRFFERFPDAALAQETPLHGTAPDGVAGEGVVGGLPRVESFISNGLARLPVVLGVPAGGGGR